MDSPTGLNSSLQRKTKHADSWWKTAGIEHQVQNGLLSFCYRCVHFFPIHNSHLFSPYLLYWKQTIAYKISSWSLLFPHICRCFRMKTKGSGGSLELLRHIQRMVHPLFCCSPDTCDESPLTVPTFLSVRQGPTPVWYTHPQDPLIFLHRTPSMAFFFSIFHSLSGFLSSFKFSLLLIATTFPLFLLLSSFLTDFLICTLLLNHCLCISHMKNKTSTSLFIFTVYPGK